MASNAARMLDALMRRGVANLTEAQLRDELLAMGPMREVAMSVADQIGERKVVCTRLNEIGAAGAADAAVRYIVQAAMSALNVDRIAHDRIIEVLQDAPDAAASGQC